MSDISKALQGKLVRRKGRVNHADAQQLDLFASLSERAEKSPEIVIPPREEHQHPEAEWVLPSSPSPPPDVTAEVRAALSESEPAPRPAEVAAESQPKRPPLRTGIYRRPERLPLARQEPPKAPANERRRTPWAWLRDWFDGVELDRRLVSLVVVLVMMVSSITYWAFSPRKEKPAPPPAVDLREIYRPQSAQEPAPPAVVAEPQPPAVAASPAAAAPTLTAADWKIAGTTATLSGNSVQLRFEDPVFVSLANISVEGMRALKAVAARLKKLENGAQIVVTGYTDNVPLSAPTAKFKSNADIAAARARNAREHLEVFVRPARGLIFSESAGNPEQAPFPNDTPQNRRLNRTITLHITPNP